MAQFHAGVLAVLSLALLLPCLQAKQPPSTLSFQLLLQQDVQPTLNLHNAPSKSQASGPHPFADAPLAQIINNDGGRVSSSSVVGSASGFYLQGDAAEVRYLYCTATLQHYIAAQGFEDETGGAAAGSVVLIGSVSGGLLSVVGGTGDFALTVGQANVSMAPPPSPSTTVALSLQLELYYYHSQIDTI
ncbi:hypothetical protein L7F22_048027 [Adiantum nelumboides]|nr:hypothetical protein [Adiantum nelumboides]